jgi:lipid-binding SYLF domain-containing protein
MDLKKTKVAGLIVFLVIVSFTLGTAIASDEKDRRKAEDIVTRAEKTFKNFASDPDMDWFRKNLGKAKAIMIVPTLGKGGLIFGGYGGSGALLAHDEKKWAWTYPAFYTMGAVTFGLQIGGAADQVILVIMTKKGLDAMLSTEFKLGADVSVAAGPVGKGVAGQTADVLAFARSKGVFGGLTVEGAVIKIRNKWNDAYYGESVRPSDILISRKVSNSQADSLRRSVRKTAGK